MVGSSPFWNIWNAGKGFPISPPPLLVADAQKPFIQEAKEAT